MTVGEMIAQVRVLLDEPGTQHPTKRHIMGVLTSNLQQYHNELQLTGAPWHLASWRLNVAPHLEEYLITAPDFGKPMLVLTQSDDPTVPEREIPITNMENFNFPPAGGSSGPWLTDGHSALCVAFYGKSAVGQASHCKVFPTPSGSAAYTVWYKPGKIPFVGLGDELLLPEHHHLIIHRVAIGCLPYCRWMDLPMETWPTKAQAIGQALQYSVAMYEDSFGRYKNNQKVESMRPRVLWGDDGF